MISGAHSILVIEDRSEWNKEGLSDKETYMSTASSEDVATDCLSDDDVPPMLTLERFITLTDYNEVSSHEWQAQAVVTHGLQPADCTLTQSFPAIHVEPQVVTEVSDLEPLSAPVFLSGQALRQWNDGYLRALSDAHANAYQHQTSRQQEYATCLVQDEDHGFDEAILSEQLSAGGEQRQQAFIGLRGQVAKLAFQKSGCRIVQQAIQVAEKEEVAGILAELYGHVYAATQSPYGNYVIQKVVTALPGPFSSFVAEELRGVAGAVARHRYGCRILCRIFEHTAAEPSSRELACELVTDAAALSSHEFAHHVIETILKHGHPEQRQSVVDALLPHFWWHSQDWFASYVIESALSHCAGNELEELERIISAGDVECILSLAQGQAGNRVLMALPKMPSHLAQNVLQSVVKKIEAAEWAYANNHVGKRLLQEFKVTGVSCRSGVIPFDSKSKRSAHKVRQPHYW